MHLGCPCSAKLHIQARRQSRGANPENNSMHVNVNLNVNNFLAISKLDYDNSGEPGPQVPSMWSCTPSGVKHPGCRRADRTGRIGRCHGIPEAEVAVARSAKARGLLDASPDSATPPAQTGGEAARRLNTWGKRPIIRGVACGTEEHTRQVRAPEVQARGTRSQCPPPRRQRPLGHRRCEAVASRAREQ